jgi:N-acetylneuraminic acid mutarotase
LFFIFFLLFFLNFFRLGFGTHGDGPCPRFAHTATLLAQNLILVFGGYDSHSFYNDLYILDLNVRKWSEVEVLGTARPPPRYAHTATIVGRQLVVFGGQGKNAALNDLWIFDLETLTWMSPTISGTPPLARSYHTANLIGDKLLIFGGKKSSQWHNDFVMLDIPDRSWNRVELKAAEEGRTLAGRAYHSANVFNDNFIVVFGG